DRSVPEAGDLMATATRVHRATTSSRVSAILSAIVLLAVLSVATGDNRSWQLKLTDICVFVVLATMWNLLAGYSGLVSVGQQAFVGLGAYGLIFFANGLNQDIYFSVIPAAIVAAVISVPIALLAFRLRGGYFAVGTWVIAEVVRLIVKNNTSKTIGGGTGTSLDVRAYEAASRIRTTSLIALVVAVLAIAVVYLILRSRLGLALQSIRDNESGAAGLGVNVYSTRMFVWIVAALFTGAAGAVFYLKTINVQPDAAFSVSAWTAPLIIMVAVGGLGTIEGPILGAVGYYMLRDWLTDQTHWPSLAPETYLITMGLLAMVFAIFVQRGIWGTLTRKFPSLQLFPLRRRVEGVDG
ncbi:MAG TPA: branched-chain amino acid ABC transporter permease, partial [Acidimicrobiales bacterium]|nr:branched-chain amino acid ABC transporter permease [Acidimicrobiales bacterium]